MIFQTVARSNKLNKLIGLASLDKAKNYLNYKMLLAIVFISGGSTYYNSKDVDKEEMAAIVVKRAVKDWKHLFKFKKNALWPVHFYDITDFDGWSADYSGKVTELGTGKEAKFLETLKVLH